MIEIPSESGNNSWTAMGKVERLLAEGINWRKKDQHGSHDQAVFCDAVGILPCPGHALIDWEHGMIGTVSTLDKHFRFSLTFP